MKLNEYLKQRKIKQKDFLAICQAHGKVSHGALAKWCNGQRIPRYNEMHIIYKATRGEVKADDFYDIGIAK